MAEETATDQHLHYTILHQVVEEMDARQDGDSFIESWLAESGIDLMSVVRWMNEFIDNAELSPSMTTGDRASVFGTGLIAGLCSGYGLAKGLEARADGG